MTERAESTNHHPGDRPRTGPEAEQELAQLVGKAIDIVVYAPIGALFEAPSLLPKLAEQGKVHVKNAEWLGGQFLERSQRLLRRRLESVGEQAADLLRMMGVVPVDDDVVPGESGPVTAPPPAPDALDQNAATGTAAEPLPPSVDDLAIPDYDSLSASQVVNRLPSLSPDELEAVRLYEAAHRGRKTILNKVLQLQA